MTNCPIAAAQSTRRFQWTPALRITKNISSAAMVQLHLGGSRRTVRSCPDLRASLSVCGTHEATSDSAAATRRLFLPTLGLSPLSRQAADSVEFSTSTGLSQVQIGGPQPPLFALVRKGHPAITARCLKIRVSVVQFRPWAPFLESLSVVFRPRACSAFARCLQARLALAGGVAIRWLASRNR